MKSTQTQIVLFLAIIFTTACGDEDPTSIDANYDVDHRQEMRDFVINISKYTKSLKPDFVVIPQNGIELVTDNGEEGGIPNTDYLIAIDGHGQEDLFYGYNEDDISTPVEENEYLRSFLDVSKNEGNTILVTDYCSTHSNMDDSYLTNESHGYMSFAADHRELDNIPAYPASINGSNDAVIQNLSDIKNFLYLINPEKYATKAEFINAISATDYDLLIMDLFFSDGVAFTSDEINSLRNKKNGGKRLVVAYMSIGEAEDYRYYWQADWTQNPPAWLDAENPNWAGNYKVKYWQNDWQKVIYGENTSYAQKLIDADFDGVYLDIIDAFEYYE